MPHTEAAGGQYGFGDLAMGRGWSGEQLVVATKGDFMEWLFLGSGFQDLTYKVNRGSD